MTTTTTPARKPRGLPDPASVADPTMLPAYRTPAQVAARLGVSRPSVYTMIDDGLIDSVKVLNCRRIRRESLLAYEASLTGGE